MDNFPDDFSFEDDLREPEDFGFEWDCHAEQYVPMPKFDVLIAYSCGHNGEAKFTEYELLQMAGVGIGDVLTYEVECAECSKINGFEVPFNQNYLA